MNICSVDHLQGLNCSACAKYSATIGQRVSLELEARKRFALPCTLMCTLPSTLPSTLLFALPCALSVPCTLWSTGSIVRTLSGLSFLFLDGTTFLRILFCIVRSFVRFPFSGSPVSPESSSASFLLATFCIFHFGSKLYNVQHHPITRHLQLPVIKTSKREVRGNVLSVSD